MEAQNDIESILQAFNPTHPDNIALKPVATVKKLTQVTESLYPGQNNIQRVQDAYRELLLQRGLNLNQIRQSWVTASGGNFEAFLRDHLNEVLNGLGIVAIKGDFLKSLGKKSANIQSLITFLTLPARRKCTQTSVDVWPDNDILVLGFMPDRKWRVLASISAKTSSHSRNTSVLFWAMAVSVIGIKYFLATQDRDNQFTKPCTSPDVNQERKLFEAYCDRVFTSNPDAGYCAQVKSLLIRPDGGSQLTDELLELFLQTAGRDHISTKVTLADLEAY